MENDKPSEPDSTTAEKDIGHGRKFAVNDEVLCHISKGDQHYLGIVIEVNNILKKCLVKFLDDTETWCNFADMKFLKMADQEVTCVVCKEYHNKTGNQLRVCACGRGYHEKCHEPNISCRDQDWKCKICSPFSKNNIERKTKQPVVLDDSDTSQGVGNEAGDQTCPCGQTGAWYRSMVQCRRCHRWFHSKCIRTLDHKVFCGDRFYVLLCSGCNQGKELCVRLSPTWPDLVHLVLYNLMLLNHNKYYELDAYIMTFINRHWHEFNLPAEMANTPFEERRGKVEAALRGCEKRFKCGREDKKKTSIWALRARGAPRAPFLTLPSRTSIDEQCLRRHLRKQMLKSQEKPLQNGYINSSRKESDSSSRNSLSITSTESQTSTDTKVGSSTEFHGCGLVKRSVPFPLVEQLNNAEARFRSHAVRRAARLLRRRKPLVEEREDSESDADAASDQSTQSKHNFRGNKSTVKQEVRKRPQRNLLEARLNSTESKLYNPQAAAEPNKRKASPLVDSPPKKKLKKTDTFNGVLRLKSEKKFVQKTIFETWRSDVRVVDSAVRVPNTPDSGSSGDEVLSLGHTTVKTVIKKRQLSEKDIVVDSNGQIRRKKRRGRLPYIQPPPPTPDLGVELKVKRPFFDHGPVTKETALDVFGPLYRIGRGENYEVLARRVLPDGRVEAIFDFPSPS